MVVGADGINSIIRNEMWRLAENLDPSAFNIKDGFCMAADLRVMFSISQNVDGLPIGQDQRTYSKNFSTLIVQSNDNFTLSIVVDNLSNIEDANSMPEMR
jgi:hypothetical protein